MDKEKVEKHITEIISGTNHAVLATIAGDEPWVRYVMTFNVEDTFKLQISTALKSRKVEQIKKNPKVHLTMGSAPGEEMGPYLQYAGTAAVKCDEKTKKEHWHDDLKMYFKGPEDPNYCVIEVEPRRIEVMGVTKDWSPLVWTP